MQARREGYFLQSPWAWSITWNTHWFRASCWNVVHVTHVLIHLNTIPSVLPSLISAESTSWKKRIWWHGLIKIEARYPTSYQWRKQSYLLFVKTFSSWNWFLVVPCLVNVQAPNTTQGEFESWSEAESVAAEEWGMLGDTCKSAVHLSRMITKISFQKSKQHISMLMLGLIYSTQYFWLKRKCSLHHK